MNEVISHFCESEDSLLKMNQFPLNLSLDSMQTRTKFPDFLNEFESKVSMEMQRERSKAYPMKNKGLAPPENCPEGILAQGRQTDYGTQ